MAKKLTASESELRKKIATILRRETSVLDPADANGLALVVVEDLPVVYRTAPELLEALKAMFNRYTGLVASGDAGHWDAETEEGVIKARAAIAKAAGGTP